MTLERERLTWWQHPTPERDKIGSIGLQIQSATPQVINHLPTQRSQSDYQLSKQMTAFRNLDYSSLKAMTSLTIEASL